MTTYSTYSGVDHLGTVGKVPRGCSPKRAGAGAWCTRTQSARVGTAWSGPVCHVVVRFDLYPCRHGIEERVIVAGMALRGQDEEMGRAIVATVAWGTTCEALGHADELAELQPSELPRRSEER